MYPLIHARTIHPPILAHTVHLSIIHIPTIHSFIIHPSLIHPCTNRYTHLAIHHSSILHVYLSFYAPFLHQPFHNPLSIHLLSIHTPSIHLIIHPSSICAPSLNYYPFIYPSSIHAPLSIYSLSCSILHPSMHSFSTHPSIIHLSVLITHSLIQPSTRVH